MSSVGSESSKILSRGLTPKLSKRLRLLSHRVIHYHRHFHCGGWPIRTVDWNRGRPQLWTMPIRRERFFSATSRIRLTVLGRKSTKKGQSASSRGGANDTTKRPERLSRSICCDRSYKKDKSRGKLPINSP